MEIEDYPDYLIYPDGRVYSKFGKGMFMKPPADTYGYLYVGLTKDGKQKNMTIHRLIGNAYIPNPENKPCIDHKDHNRQNNDISNLRWVTHSENNRNRQVSGEIPFKGVCKIGKKFQARIKIDGKRKNLGMFDTAEKASEAYNKCCRENGIIIYN